MDDSVFSRGCSKKVEMLAKIFDHAKHAYLYGFRMLTLGWTDGNTFLPVNQVLLSSTNENRINDSGEIDHRCNGYKRRKLAFTKGTDAMIELIKEAKKASLPADYVLCFSKVINMWQVHSVSQTARPAFRISANSYPPSS